VTTLPEGIEGNKMTDLILLTFANGEVIRCDDLADAKSKALAFAEGRVIVEITLEGTGGLMTTLEFDREIKDWIAV
jgi:hypothetical protein